MQIAPFAIAAVALLAASRAKKKKPKESSKPRVETFGRVERLLNVAAINASLSSDEPPPTILYAYAGEGPALDRMTKVMYANAEMFRNVEFYQLRLSDLKRVIKMGGELPKGVAGDLVGVHSSGSIWPTHIFPNDDIADMSVKVVHRMVFAMTGKKPEIKAA